MENVSKETAKELRSLVELSKDKEYSYGERYEAQLVAEVYHKLRERGYEVSDILIEGNRNKKKNGKEYMLYADIVYWAEKYTIVEVKAFYYGFLKKNGEINSGAAERVRKDYRKLMGYSTRSDVDSLAMVIAYVGSNDNFNEKIYRNSVFSSIPPNAKMKGRRGQKVRVVIV